MKTKLSKYLILLAFICSVFGLQAEVKLISEDKVWDYALQYSEYNEVSGQYLINYDHHLMAFKGTTEINGKEYHKLFYSDANKPVDFNQPPVAYMRETDGRVFMISDSSAYLKVGIVFSSLCLKEEVLIYDFNLMTNEYIDLYESDEINDFSYRMPVRWQLDSIAHTDIDGNSCIEQYASIYSIDNSEPHRLINGNELTIQGIGTVNSGLLPFPYIHDMRTSVFLQHICLYQVRSTDGSILYTNKSVPIIEPKLISEDKVWDYIHYTPEYNVDKDYTYFNPKHWMLQFKGVKGIGGEEYHKLYCSEEDEPIDFNLPPIAYMREGNGRIYMLRDSSAFDRLENKFSFGYHDKASVIYDFNLDKGAEMPINFDKLNNGFHCSMMIAVDSISVTMIKGEPACTQHVSIYHDYTIENMVADWAFCSNDCVIEGVGAINAGLLPFPFLEDDISNPWRDHTSLYQLRTANGEILYTAPTVSVTTLHSDPAQISVSSSGLVIDCDHNWQLEVTSTAGARITTRNGNGKAIVPIRSLAPGIYIAALRANGNIHTMKFVK